ncbi:MAG: hypothetical protein M1482_07560 [Chloroflexi bacterium]|nr:hypothetical protein [Chloroflexota bacterium]
MTTNSLQRIERLGTVPFIFMTIWLTHLLGSGPGPMDSIWTIHTALSILREGSTNLDAYSEVIPQGDYRIETVGGHLYSRYPIGPALVSIPVVFLIDHCHDCAWPSDLYDYLRHDPPGPIVMIIEMFVASLTVALTAVGIYFIARRYLDQKYSLLVTAVFAYGTSAWSTASMALWSHGPSMFFLTLSLLLILRARDTPRLIQFVGVPLALSYVMRPTNIIPVVVWTLFVFVRYRRWFRHYLCWALPIAVLFLSYNLTIYHSLLSPYYRPETLGSPQNLPEALAGTLVSPSRGLFIFSPVLLFFVFGLRVKRKTVGLEGPDYCVLTILSLHWILISTNSSWWGGHGFGPRLFTDMIPYLIYMVIPAVGRIPRLVGSKKLIYVSVFVTALVVSCLIHFRGVTSNEVYAWNEQPTEVGENTSRLWDWRDIQFLRGTGLSQYSSEVESKDDRPLSPN